MSQPASPTHGLPTLGTIPLGPDEPQLFAEAMERIIRRLGEPGASRHTNVATGLPVRQVSHSG